VREGDGRPTFLADATWDGKIGVESRTLSSRALLPLANTETGADESPSGGISGMSIDAARFFATLAASK
jgi:hypothetical protein